MTKRALFLRINVVVGRWRRGPAIRVMAQQTLAQSLQSMWDLGCLSHDIRHRLRPALRIVASIARFLKVILWRLMTGGAFIDQV